MSTPIIGELTPSGEEVIRLLEGYTGKLVRREDRLTQDLGLKRAETVDRVAEEFDLRFDPRDCEHVETVEDLIWLIVEAL